MITPEQIAALEETHKRVAHVHAKDTLADGKTWEWELVVRVPTRAEYKGWRQKLHGDGAADATEQLVRRIAVLPADIDAYLDVWPGVAEACIPAIKRMCGNEADTDRK